MMISITHCIMPFGDDAGAPVAYAEPRFMGYALEHWACHAKEFCLQTGQNFNFLISQLCFKWSLPHPCRSLELNTRDPFLEVLDSNTAAKTHLHTLCPLATYLQNYPDVERLYWYLHQPNAAHGTAALIHAEDAGDAIVVEHLLLLSESNKIKLDVNADDQHGNPILHAACIKGHKEVVRVLLSYQGDPSLDVNAKEETIQGTALGQASSHGHVEIVRLLLADERVDPEARDQLGVCPLLIASQGDNLRGVVEAFVQCERININGTCPGLITALMLASSLGQKEVVKTLLRHPRIDIDQGDSNGWSALCYASGKGHVPVVQALLEDGRADPNARTRDVERLWTPLLIALDHGQIQVAECLLSDPRIDPNVRCPAGWTPLLIASRDGHIGVVKALLSNPRTDVNARPQVSLGSGQRPRRGRTLQSRLGAFADSLLLGAISKLENISPQPGALGLAARFGHGEVVRVLLEDPRFDPNAKSSFPIEATPLMEAARQGHLESTLVLLDDPRVDIDAQSNLGMTALMLASEQGFPDIVTALLSHGANAQLRTGKVLGIGRDMTALLLAAEEALSPTPKGEPDERFPPNQREESERREGCLEVIRILRRDPSYSLITMGDGLATIIELSPYVNELEALQPGIIFNRR